MAMVRCPTARKHPIAWIAFQAIMRIVMTPAMNRCNVEPVSLTVGRASNRTTTFTGV